MKTPPTAAAKLAMTEDVAAAASATSAVSARRYMAAIPSVNGTAHSAATSVASHGQLGTKAACSVKKRMKKATAETSIDNVCGTSARAQPAEIAVVRVPKASRTRSRRPARTANFRATNTPAKVNTNTAWMRPISVVVAGSQPTGGSELTDAIQLTTTSVLK
jgi:hypothetical protein